MGEEKRRKIAIYKLFINIRRGRRWTGDGVRTAVTSGDSAGEKGLCGLLTRGDL